MPPPRHATDHPLDSAIDHARIDRVLSAIVTDPDDRAFLRRCMLDEGPAHHRGDNYVLLALLGEVLARLPAGTTADTPQQPLTMRLPPVHQSAAAPKTYPIGFPTDAVELVAGGDPARRDVLLACLGDGPAHHAVANAAMVGLLHQILHRLGAEAA
jgi:hypothetical protein